MIDGLLVGVLLFLAGLAIGGGGVWAMERWHDHERMTLYHHMGEMQREIEARPSIPEEEM